MENGQRRPFEFVFNFLFNTNRRERASDSALPLAEIGRERAAHQNHQIRQSSWTMARVATWKP